MKPALITEAAQIAELIQQGIAAWEAAGVALVRLIDGGNTIEEIHAQMPREIPIGALEAFEKIGRKQVVPALLLAEYPAASHLRRLPFDQQESVMSGGCTLLIMPESGPDTLRCDVADLTSDQCKQVFSGASVRSPSQQRAWIESERARKAVARMAEGAVVEPYVIHKGKVLFNRACAMTRQQIAVLLAQMEGGA